jgi:hypothetical protein
MKHVLSYKWQIGIVGFALAVRLIYFFLNYEAHGRDIVATMKGDDGYYEITQNIVLGRGFVNDAPPAPPITPNPLRPPLWPLMAAAGEHIGGHWAVVIMLLVMGSLIPLLGARLVPLLSEHAGLRGEAAVRRLTLWVAFALVVEPYSILLSTIMYTETSFTFLFLIGLWFLLAYLRAPTWRRIVWAAFFLGLACLIKPTIQYAWILVPAFIVLRELSRVNFVWGKVYMRVVLVQSLVFAVLFSTLLVPWIIRNHREFGIYGMSAQPAYNLYTYLVPTVRALRNHTNFGIEHKIVFDQPGFDENYITLATSDTYTHDALQILKGYKKELITNAFISSLTFFTHDGMLTVLQYAGVVVENRLSKPAFQLLTDSPIAFIRLVGTYVASPAVLIIVVRLTWYAVLFGLFAGFVFLCRSDKGKWYMRLFSVHGFVALLMLYFMTTTMINGLGVNARFRVPLLALIFTISFIGLHRLYDMARLYLHGKRKVSNR